MLTHRPVLPNILFILTDQQRHDAVGWVNPAVRTPNLDRLAARSVVCTAAYASSPQCQPGRASLLTGKYPTAHQVWWNHCPLAARHRVLPQLLEGYGTAWFGKLDLARRSAFDCCWTFEDWRAGADREAVGEFDEVMSGPTWTGRFECDPRRHHEWQAVDRALGYIGRASGPWFCGVGFYGPHPPYAAPRPYCDLYEPGALELPGAVLRGDTEPNDRGYRLDVREWGLLRSQYYGQVSWIDELVGELLRGVGEDAVVVFTSDHGDILGDHGLFSKGLYAYEGNTRVPLLLRLPGVPPGRHGWLVRGVDLVPTLLEFLGLRAPAGLQGGSLLGPLRGEPGNESVLSMVGSSERLRMVRWGRHKYWAVGRRERLFDLLSDPGEEADLSGSEPELLSEGRWRLLRGLIEAEDPLPLPVRPG